MKIKFYIELIFLLSLGALTTLSLPPFNFFIINFLTFSLLYIFLVKKFEVCKNKRLFFLYGWLFGFGYFISNLYWVSISLTFDENFKFLIPLAIILVPGFLALFYGLVTYLFALLKLKKNLSSFFLFSLIFGIIEFIRGSILTGFPWNLIAFSFSNQLEILNIISIIGHYILLFFKINCLLRSISILPNLNFLLVSLYFVLFKILLILSINSLGSKGFGR